MEMRITVFYGREEGDAEKAILPALIYCKKTIGTAEGFGFGLVWWDFGVRLLFSRRGEPEALKG
jgi:hypothetical protein